jgi:hypothetical protein
MGTEQQEAGTTGTLLRQKPADQATAGQIETGLQAVGGLGKGGLGFGEACQVDTLQPGRCAGTVVELTPAFSPSGEAQAQRIVAGMEGLQRPCEGGTVETGIDGEGQCLIPVMRGR